jgi:hypothetical protein
MIELKCVGGEVVVDVERHVQEPFVYAQRRRGAGRTGEKRVIHGIDARKALQEMDSGTSLDAILPARVIESIAHCTGCEGKASHIGCSLRGKRRNFSRMK